MNQLRRDLGKWDLVALVLNFVVGAGIFGIPARAFALAGAYSLLAYVACALASVLIILCFAEVSSRFDRSGGVHVYAREAFGRFTGFQMGWLSWLARLAGFAALCNLFVDYLGYFAPDVAAGSGRFVTVLAVVCLLAGANLTGVQPTGGKHRRRGEAGPPGSARGRRGVLH